MRKSITFLLAFALLLTLCACGEVLEESSDPIFVPKTTVPVIAEAKSPIVSETAAITDEVLKEYTAKLLERYPDILSAETIGKTSAGRDLTLIKLGKGEKKLLAVAEFHACEHITSLYLMKCIEDYAEAFSSDSGELGGYSVKELLNEYTVYAVPCCNPDGAYLMWNGGETLCADYDARFRMKANGNGADLNRNFPFMWDEADTGVYEPSERYYKGDSAASENETKALMKLCEYNRFELMLSFHSQGRCIFWRDDTNGEIYGDEELVNALCDVTGFVPQPVTEGNAAYGGFENWFRSEFDKPGFCVELVATSIKSDTTLTELEDFSGETDYEETQFIILEAIKTLMTVNNQ